MQMSSLYDGETENTPSEETTNKSIRQLHCSCCARCRSRSKWLREAEPLSSWITVGASFFMTFGSILFQSGIGLLYTPLAEYYNASKANVGISGFLLMSVGSLSGTYHVHIDILLLFCKTMVLKDN
jgi:hypothetical protein